MWQRTVLERDEALIKQWEKKEVFPPSSAPEDDAAWQTLAETFLASSQRAVELARDEAWLASGEGAENPGLTWRNALEQLAVHNA